MTVQTGGHAVTAAQGHEDVLWCCLLLAMYINSADRACLRRWLPFTASSSSSSPPWASEKEQLSLDTTQNSVYVLDVGPGHIGNTAQGLGELTCSQGNSMNSCLFFFSPRRTNDAVITCFRCACLALPTCSRNVLLQAEWGWEEMVECSFDQEGGLFPPLTYLM